MFSALLAALPFEACELSSPHVALRVKAECASLEVSEDPENAASKRIALRVAVVRSRDPDPLPDPIVFLAGGPGQAATESIAAVYPAFARAAARRDLVLVDQRGTGGSNRLDCPASKASADAAIVEDTKACLATLPGDPRFYTTTIAASDLERVRVALGYGPMNLVGVSYGTRLASTYLRRYEASVRTVVLDGVVPSQLALGTSHAKNLDRALGLLFDRCSRDAQCRAFGDLRDELGALVSNVASEEIEIADPRTGARRKVPVDRPALVAAIRFLAYAPETAALIPVLIHDARTSGRLDRIAAQGAIVEASLGGSLAAGMELSVLCSEDVPFYGDVMAPEGSLLGDQIIRTARLRCSVWPRGEVPGDFHEPVSSAVPALLLSGDADPVTPPAEAEVAARHLSSSQQVVILGQGHNVIGRGCVPKLIAAFLDAPSARLDTRCLGTLAPAPFFTSLAGPSP